MLSDDRQESRFADVCSEVYQHVVEGNSLSEAMRKTEGFTEYACDMVSTGEQSGHIESVLRNLELYYGEEDRMFEKLRSSLSYPLALLLIMAAILLFTALVVLPMFTNVYQNMAGSLAAVSFTSVETATTVAWVAFAIIVVCAIVAGYLWIRSGSEAGRIQVVKIFEGFAPTKASLYQMALSRFTASLATFVSTGMTSEEALAKARSTVDHNELAKRVDAAYESMVNLDNPLSLTQALDESGVIDPLYARILNVASRAGRTDESLAELSSMFFEDAIVQIDRSLDRIEPMLAAFMTIAIAISLIAVMLPLVGILGSIG